MLCSISEVHAPFPNELQLNTNRTTEESPGEIDTIIPTKNDGTADMRYAVSKDAVASGAIVPNQPLTDGNDTMPSSISEISSGRLIRISVQVSSTHLFIL